MLLQEILCFSIILRNYFCLENLVVSYKCVFSQIFESKRIKCFEFFQVVYRESKQHTAFPRISAGTQISAAPLDAHIEIRASPLISTTPLNTAKPKCIWT